MSFSEPQVEDPELSSVPGEGGLGVGYEAREGRTGLPASTAGTPACPRHQWCRPPHRRRSSDSLGFRWPPTLNRRQPLLPLRPGIPARRTHDYKRDGLTSLYAALAVATGKVIGECSPTHRGPDFLRFLQKVARSFPRRQLHVIVDRSSTHSSPDVNAGLAAHPRVSLHFTPTSASWVNLVESWFALLTRKSLRRGSVDSVARLVRHIEALIAHWNENPTPFVWTKSADEILKKARRAN